MMAFRILGIVGSVVLLAAGLIFFFSALLEPVQPMAAAEMIDFTMVRVACFLGGAILFIGGWLGLLLTLRPAPRPA